MIIRLSKESDRGEITTLHQIAFGEKEGREVAKLASDLLDDETASPMLSLVATEQGKIIGHILFTSATIARAAEPISARILAPLAVMPESQNYGIGGQLIKEGLKLLKEKNVELVFVLGHPDYYPRHGFTPAGELGFEAPYPIPDKHADAWMVQELRSGVTGKVSGIVQCSDVMNQPEHWRE